MDLTLSEVGAAKLAQVKEFMDSKVIPAEPEYARQRRDLAREGKSHHPPRVLLDLTEAARDSGLWNLFLPGANKLKAVDYAYLAEETGRSPFIGPAAMNCLSPDSGNMEMLLKFGTEAQRRRWLDPLLAGSTRSAFSMTEPDVSSSDATNVATTIRREGNEYVVNGRKWFTTAAADPRTSVLFVVGRSREDGPRREQHSVLIVPKDTPGVTVIRNLPVFGFQEQQGHSEVLYEDVRVPVENLLGEEHKGLSVAQARLGAGRIHHCMRAVGMAERALSLMCRRATDRVAFGKPLAQQGVVRADIARSRLEIDQARLFVLACAWKLDEVGVEEALADISAVKAVVPSTALAVVDRTIQLFGAAGVTNDLPLAEIWTRLRTLRIADGPDEVHIRAVARRELAKHGGVDR